MEKADGGPAFPLALSGDRDPNAGWLTNYGMSVRHYFAAHAPDVPPGYDPPPYPVPKPRPPAVPQELADPWREYSFKDDPPMTFAEFVADWFKAPDWTELADHYVAERGDWVGELRRWQNDKAAYAVVMWRWHYADAMIEAGGRS